MPKCANARERRLRLRTKLMALWAMRAQREAGARCAGGARAAAVPDPTEGRRQAQPQQNPKTQTHKHRLVKSTQSPEPSKYTGGPPMATPNPRVSETTTRSMHSHLSLRSTLKILGCHS